MNFEDVPIVRLELEKMRSSIISHLGLVGSELGEALDKRISQAIETYDFDGQVTTIAHQIITAEINDFFRYGKGHDCIKSAVENALNKTFNGGEKE